MYPVSTKNDVAQYVSARQAGGSALVDLHIEFRGNPSADWVDEIDNGIEMVLESWRSFDLTRSKTDQSRDAIEGHLSQVLFEQFSNLPASVLTDRDFWRYCAARLYDFVVWRQPSSTVMALLPHFGSATIGLGRECVPHRMFGRALIAQAGGIAAGDEDPFRLARFGASDVWKSHILRVANGNAPIVVREMLLDVEGGRLKTEVVRPFVKNLRRVRSNVLFEVLDQYQARVLVDRERERTLETQALLSSEVDKG